MIPEYHNAIRKHVIREQERGATQDLISYTIQSTEVFNSPLVSYRLYGSYEYADIVRLICGLSYVSEPLPQKTVFFPTFACIQHFKNKYN